MCRVFRLYNRDYCFGKFKNVSDDGWECRVRGREYFMI